METLKSTFTAYGDSLHRVEVFKYLGRLVSYDDVNTQAIRWNLKKCRKTWARISKVLRAKNTSPWVCGMFYRATVQSMLLYGSVTRTLAPANLAMMEGFHVHTACHMAGMMPRKRGNVWEYLKSREVLAAVGLRSVEHCIGVRRATIARWITHRPIFDLCKETERRRGSTPRQFWWEQSLDLPPSTEGGA